MRVTFDSNVWQSVAKPSLSRKTKLFEAFKSVHEALLARQIHGFICETVGTLEAVKRLGRQEYFASVKPVVEISESVLPAGQISLAIKVGANHNQHPGLPAVLRERLELTFALGIRLMRAPRIAMPVPSQFLDLSFFAEELDVPTSAARYNRWGEVVEAIERRGVGSAVLSGRDREGKFKQMGDREFGRAVSEWADGDSVEAHVAY